MAGKSRVSVAGITAQGVNTRMIRNLTAGSDGYSLTDVDERGNVIDLSGQLISDTSPGQNENYQNRTPEEITNATGGLNYAGGRAGIPGRRR